LSKPFPLFRARKVHATRLRRVKRNERESERERERERERAAHPPEKEKKRKDDDDVDERIFLRIFSSSAFEFSVVGDDSGDENDVDLYHEEANEENVHHEKRFGFRSW
tara:strand:+ start:632 stop:955 length:324 start_codon:yes stop_codon:yes gene_type:complete